MTKKILISLFALFFISGIVLGATRIYAQNTTSSYPPIIQKLTEKFGLKPDEVKNVFNDVRNDEQSKRQAEMQSQIEQSLSEAVKAGKITEAQKQAIIQKQKELQQRRAAEQQELQSWAQQNGIDMQYLLMGGKGLKFGGRMHW